MKRPKDKKPPREVFVRNREHWIRYVDQNGRLHREKVGPFLEAAKRAAEKRRSEIREGKSFPEMLRQRVVLFGEIAKDYLDTRRSKRGLSQDEDRVDLLLEGQKAERKAQALRNAGPPRPESPSDPQDPLRLKSIT